MATVIEGDPMAVVKVSARRDVAQALEALGLAEVDEIACEEIIGTRLRDISSDIYDIADGQLPCADDLRRLVARLSSCLNAVNILEAGV